MTASKRARFGRIVRERRAALGLTQDDIAAAGGPSDTTQTRIENAEGHEPSATTRNRYDHALRWEPGSATRVWNGGHPSPLPDPRPLTASAVADRPFSLGPMEVPVSLEQLNEVFDILNTLTLVAEDTPENAPLTAATDALRQFVASLTGTWVTEVLERNRHLDNTVPTMIEFAFSAHLATPVHMHEPDAKERLYRRWLIGRTSGIPAELIEQFEERFAGRMEGTL